MMLGEDGGLETYTELNAVALDLHKPDPKKMVQRRVCPEVSLAAGLRKGGLETAGFRHVQGDSTVGG